METSESRAANSQEPRAARTPEATLALPDERTFKEGFCHALALELAGAFAEAGKPADFYFIPSRGHGALAEHVLIKSGDGFFDVHFGPQAEAEVIARWAEKTAGRLEKVGHRGWIESPCTSSEHHSYLGLCVKPALLSAARLKAKAFIARHPAQFGLESQR